MRANFAPAETQYAHRILAHLLEREAPQRLVLRNFTKAGERGNFGEKRLVAAAVGLWALCVIQRDAAVGGQPRERSERGAITKPPRQHKQHEHARTCEHAQRRATPIPIGQPQHKPDQRQPPRGRRPRQQRRRAEYCHAERRRPTSACGPHRHAPGACGESDADQNEGHLRQQQVGEEDRVRVATDEQSSHKCPTRPDHGARKAIGDERRTRTKQRLRQAGQQHADLFGAGERR